VKRTCRCFALVFSSAALLIAAICVSISPAWSQDVTASITGTVTDPSGGAIAGATVTATEINRGTVYTAKTNDTGIYNLLRIPIGTYNVKAESKGFESAAQSSITLVLNQIARLDFSLKVGATSETVEVTSDQPVLQTQDTQLGVVIDSTTNTALPLASRNYIQLTLLAPGSVTPNPQTLTNAQRIDSAGRPYINGNREQSNNFLLDGMDNNQVSDNLVGYTPSPDAIQEFNEITQNAPAEFGNFSGGIVSVSLKSGTNQFHGDAFEFFRNDKLNANNWFNDLTGTPKPGLRWNMFGGTLGGPVIKNKLFFFTDYQGQRFDNPSTTSTFNVFTAAERGGDFGALCTDPIVGGAWNSSGTACTGAGGKAVGTVLINPNTGNIVPYNNLATAGLTPNPVATALFASSFYPAAIGTSIQNNALFTTSTALNVDQGDAKIDWDLSNKDRLFFRFSDESQNNPETISVPILPVNTGNAIVHSGVLNWTHNFGTNLLNQAMFGANYVDLNTLNTGSSAVLGDLGKSLGIPNGNDTGAGLLGINFTDFETNIGGSGVTQKFADTVFQAEDNLIYTHGRHTIRAGFQFWRERIDTYYSGNNGVLGFFQFSGRYTGAPEADLYLGMADQNGRGIVGGTWGQRSSIFAPYVQDDWQIKPNLTLNVGVRYQAHTPWYEVHNQQANFGLYTGTEEFPAGAPPPTANCAGCNAPINGSNRALYQGYYGIADFEPRIGIAWTPGFLNDKTVFRAAFTTSDYLEGTGTNLRLPLNPPFGTEDFTDYDSLNSNVPPTLISDGLTLSPPSDPFANATLRVWNPHVRPAIAEEWNLSIQQLINSSTTFQVSYVGQKGTHLMVPMWLEQGDLLSNGTIAPSPFLAGNPALLTDIGSGGVKGTFSNGVMTYNALQAVLKKTFSNGLEGQVSYTYSKCMTNSSGYYGSWGGQTTPASPYWQNMYDMAAEWGPCYYDVTHQLTSYAVYDLPFGHGRHFGKDMNPIENAVVGNWTVSPIWTWHGGFPITVSDGDFSGTGSQGGRADCLGQPKYLKKYTSAGVQWFDPSVYANPANGTFGTCGVAGVRGPGLNDVDMSLQKNFPITEAKSIQFRAEFINLFNHPVFNSPSGGCSGAAGTPCANGLGLITSSQLERNIQFALKFIF
jgi:hypothetical protein